MTDIEGFVKDLSEYPPIPLTSNLYGPDSDGMVRAFNLTCYLKEMRLLKPTVMLLGEAPGYRGCRLTGIPFTSEIIMAEHAFFKGKSYKPIDSTKIPEDETSARSVWKVLDNTNIYPLPLIWNAFPFHPHKGSILENRTPRAAELETGRKFITSLLKIFDIQKIYALGRKAEFQMEKLKKDRVYTGYVKYVRHPGRGGSVKFSDELTGYFTGKLT